MIKIVCLFQKCYVLRSFERFRMLKKQTNVLNVHYGSLDHSSIILPLLDIFKQTHPVPMTPFLREYLGKAFDHGS